MDRLDQLYSVDLAMQLVKQPRLGMDWIECTLAQELWHRRGQNQAWGWCLTQQVPAIDPEAGQREG